MAILIDKLDANTDTFANWLAVTNSMADAISSHVLTANITGSNTGNSTVSYISRLFGSFTANTIGVTNTVIGPTSGANVSVQANVKFEAGSSLYTVGALNVKGDIVIDTTAKLRLLDRSTLYAANTGWLKANSTGYVQVANLAVKGTDLDPTEFALTSALGYATSTNTTYDVVAYNSTASKWVRTRLTHLVSQEIDALVLGTVTANAATGEIRVNGNTNFGGSTTSLFVSNTAARVGVGGVTNPAASLHVQGAIYATGDVTAFYTSDSRLKINVKRISDPLEKLRWINGVTFDWDQAKISELDNVGPKPDSDIGLLAQEVEQVFPQAVTKREDGYKAVDYAKLVPVLLEAIKELSYKINIVEAELEDKYRSSSR